MPRDQAVDAQGLYDDRAHKYDDSHHPRFARHMVELAQPRAGEQVLDLACGTGLISFPASTAVGSTGSVHGVDVSSGMLEQARNKQSAHALKNVTFHQHSMTDLDSLEAIKGMQFDLVTCCSALVLLENPDEAVKHWATFLKPGGRLIVDVTHPQNLTPGILFEKVGHIIGHPVPWYRLNFESPDDLSKTLTHAGLSDIQITFLSQQQIPGTEDLEDYKMDLQNPRLFREYNVEEADRVFEEQVGGNALKTLASPPDVREKAKSVFREEWKKSVNERGKVQEVDGVFVGLGWKRSD